MDQRHQWWQLDVLEPTSHLTRETFHITALTPSMNEVYVFKYQENLYVGEEKEGVWKE